MQRMVRLVLGALVAALIPISGALVSQPAAAFALTPISGRITDAVTHDPLAGVCVRIAHSPTGMYVGGWCSDANGSYTAYADADAGPAYVEFHDNTGYYFDIYSGGSATAAGAQPVTVTAGVTTTLDIGMIKGGIITGVALDTAGAPVAGICGQAFVGRTQEWAGSAYPCSGPDGVWRAHGLPAGSYTVNLTPEYQRPYLATWVGSKKGTQDRATLFPVTPGQVVQAPPTQFAVAGVITGRVVGPDGSPLAGVIVAPTGSYDGRAGWGEGPYEVRTDDQGRFTVTLPPGDYPALFWSDTFAPEWSGNAVTRKSAKPIRVKAGATVTANAQLEPASRVDVHVVDAAGTMYPGGVAGLVYTSTGDYIGDFDQWQGQTVSTPLPAGSFTLEVNLESGQQFWYDRAVTPAAATRVTLTVGQTRTVTAVIPGS